MSCTCKGLNTDNMMMLEADSCLEPPKRQTGRPAHAWIMTLWDTRASAGTTPGQVSNVCINCYLFERQCDSKGQGERDILSTGSLPRLSPMAWAGSNWSQEPGTIIWVSRSLEILSEYLGHRLVLASAPRQGEPGQKQKSGILNLCKPTLHEAV